MKKRIFIIDAYNLFYRLFYAVPPFTTKAGEPVNAVFWMARMILQLHESEKPDYLFVVADSKGKNFRSEIYPEYKWTRDRMPDDLRAQEARVYELLATMDIPVLALMGYEADDIIGTLVTELRKNAENDIYILSGDKDLYQFIDGNVAVYDTTKRIIARTPEAIAKFGVEPRYVVDYLSIVGDSSDNIPGIPWFGPKKAESLISQFGNLENIYERMGELPEKTRAVLEANREVAFLSKRLASIDTAVPVEYTLEGHEFASRPIRNERLNELLRELEFRSLITDEVHEHKKFDSLGIEPISIETAETLQKLQDTIASEKRISIATMMDGGQMYGIVIGLSGNRFYSVRSNYLKLDGFIQFLLEWDGEVVGYDLKSELKILWKYLDQSSEVLDGENLSMF